MTRGIDVIESLLCALFSTVMFLLGGFAAAAFVTSSFLDKQQVFPLQPVVAVIVALGWLALDLPYMIQLLLLGLRSQHPVALNGALGQPMLPLPLRPLVALWWFAHFLPGAWLAALFHSFAHGSGHWLILLPAFGMSYSANGFLMLSVCAITQSQTIRMRIWQFRLLIDLGLVLVGAFLIARIIGP